MLAQADFDVRWLRGSLTDRIFDTWVARLREAGATVLRGKRDLQDIARLRIACDIVINVQTTDSLSASIQEHLMAGARLIVGDWLPYGIFERIGADIRRVDTRAAITEALEANISRKPAARTACSQAIYDRSSWDSCIGQWMDLYRGQI